MKLCHDLSGIASTISNGVYILKDEHQEKGFPGDEIVTLVGESADNFVSKIKFFRQSFGYFDSSVTFEIKDLLEIIRGYLKIKEVTLEIEDTSLRLNLSQEQNFLVGKFLLKIVIVANDTLIKGGKIKIDYGVTNNKLYIKSVSQGDKVKLSEAVYNALNSKNTQEVTVYNICAALLSKYAEENHFSVDFKSEETFFELRLQEI